MSDPAYTEPFPAGYPAAPAPSPESTHIQAETTRPDLEGSVAVLYDEAKRTIAQWCREADESARKIIANAETTRQMAHAEADRIRQAARSEAGRILADAEAQAGEIRAGAQVSGADRGEEIEALHARVDRMSGAIDHLLDSLDGVLKAVAALGPRAESGGSESDQTA